KLCYYSNWRSCFRLFYLSIKFTTMKIRDSGMPPEEMWDKFFDPGFILSKLQLDNNIEDVVEFGSGYGTFSLHASQIIKGRLYALDIDDLMIDILNQKISENKIKNITVLKTDFNNGTGLKQESADYVMMFNILHAEDPLLLLNEANRVLKQNGRIGVIHWIYSADTPRGPSLDIRPTEEQCINWLNQAGFKVLSGPEKLPPYHYGIVGIKK
ncbi:MAG: class I SAM-dependent methyltransferase, partial [Ignavibacteriaceae bacterium]